MSKFCIHNNYYSSSKFDCVLLSLIFIIFYRWFHSYYFNYHVDWFYSSTFLILLWYSQLNSFTILNLHSILFQHYLCWHFPTYKIGIVWEIPILFPNTFEQFPTKRGQILRYITSTSLMIWNGSYAHTLSNILHIVFLYLLSSSEWPENV